MRNNELPQRTSNQQIFKNTWLLYVRMLVIMIVSLYTSRIVLRILGVDDYGIYNVVGGVVSLLGFFSTALNTATQRFLNYEMGKGDTNGMNKIFSISFWCFLMIALAIIILGETLGLWFVKTQLNIPVERTNAAYWVYHFSVFAFAVNILSVPYNAAIIAHEKMSIYAFISIGEAILKLALVFLLSFLNYDKLILYAILMFALTSILTTTYWIVCRICFTECRVTRVWDKGLFLGLFSFSGWMLIGTMNNILSTQGINILINIFFGTALNAARAIAMQVQGAVNMFVTNFMTAIRPPIVKAYAQEDFEYMYKLTFSASRMAFYLLLILSVPILANTHRILTLWLEQVPDYSVLFTQLVLIDLLITASYNPIAYVNQATGRIKAYQLVISIGFLLIFLVTWGLYRVGLPVEVCFYVAIVIDIIGLFARLFVSNRIFSFPIRKYLTQVTGRVGAIFLVATISSWLLNVVFPVHNLFFLFLNSLLSIILTGSVIWMFGMDSSEKAMIKSMFLNKIIQQKA